MKSSLFVLQSICLLKSNFLCFLLSLPLLNRFPPGLIIILLVTVWGWRPPPPPLIDKRSFFNGDLMSNVLFKLTTNVWPESSDEVTVSSNIPSVSRSPSLSYLLNLWCLVAGLLIESVTCADFKYFCSTGNPLQALYSPVPPSPDINYFLLIIELPGV